MSYLKEIEQITSKLINKLLEKGFYESEILMPQHLVTAAMNGFCPEDMYAMSIFDREAYQSSNLAIVDAKIDLLLFMYAYSKLALNPEAIIVVDQAKIFKRINCTFKIYSEYVELMQKLSRHFRNKPEMYIELLINLTAYLHCHLSAGYIRLESILHIKRFTNGEIVIRLPKDEEISLPFLGGRVFIPGCGLSIISHLNILQQMKDVEFILNDMNPFVAGVVTKVVSLKNLNNILVNHGNFVDCELPDNIGLVVLSLLHRANKGDFIRLAENLSKKMTKNGQVIGFFPDLNLKTVNSHQCVSIFSDYGFKPVKFEPTSYQKVGIDDLGAKILAALPETFVNKFHNYKPSTLKGYYFVLQR